MATKGITMTMHVDRVAPAVPTSLPHRRAGRLFVAGRVVWLVLTGLLVFLFLISIPGRYDQLRHPPASVQDQLARAGIPAVDYAAYLTGLNIIFAVVCGVAAAVIVLHRWNDGIGLFASLFLLLMGMASPPVMDGVVAGFPSLTRLANGANFLFSLFLLVFFFLFPDGRFVPRWSRVPVLAGCAAAAIACALTNPAVMDPPGWMGLMMLGGTAAGIAAQVYRYLKVSDPIERQKAKWVSLGVTGALVTSLVIGFLGPLTPSVGRADSGYGLTGLTSNAIAYSFIPVTLAIAILRYHLWDIDIVLNRTLVYGVLTAALLGLYLAVAEGVGALIRTGRQLPLTLLATALVAVLFAPLRLRLQAAVNRLMYGDRDNPYRVLTRLGERVGAALAPASVLTSIAETIASSLKSPHVAIMLNQPSDDVRAVSYGEPGVSLLRLPLEYQGKTVGELLVAPRGPGEEYSPEDRRLLDDLARQIGPAIHAIRLSADLQRARERLVTAREEERRRLRRDLHDGLGPQLAALTLKIETIRNRFARDNELDAALVDLTARTQSALADIRHLVYGLRPPALDELGLVPAIRQIAAQLSEVDDGRLNVTVIAPDSMPPLPAAVEVAVYWIVQEGLTNVVRHARAHMAQVAISVMEGDDRLHLEIVDDGGGLASDHRSGVGLLSMRERAEELGGHLTITSRPDAGTVIAADLPCAREQPGAAKSGLESPGGSDPDSHRG